MATDPGNTGIRRLIKASGYSMQGLAAAFRHETAFRQELAITVLLLPLALWLGQTGPERALLIAVWMLVPLFELMNSAIEAVVDRIGPEQHELSGRAKDIGSAAVLVALVNAAVVWLLILVF
ncbi:MAG: diacylglycerol kinase [Gammaproteobacteria bacterium]|nr:diacylglycerol kinase [Gammaproteobacteria bacterium]MDH3887024.1 diacylglycerol kinase [Gammaproteobacteria bacterium]MDH3934170.1 diacylglycerol kinase [Gammaproteobacteria bacterium]MDH3985246.1 diacylglycerol kinase [Gammaproteobacteria bacterium]